MTINLDNLKVGDSVHFKNGQVAKILDIKIRNDSSVSLFFNKEVACDVGDPKDLYDTYWYYDKNGECIDCTNHIIKIMKGEKTMNKKKIEKSLEWHKRKIEELEKVLKEPKRKRWFPKNNETYHAVGIGHVEMFHNFTEETTKEQYSVNNVFKTAEEAEKEYARRKAETELLDMCDWTSACDRMWMIFYDRGISKFNVDYYFSQQHTAYNFASEESARKAINALGEEKLKLIFRI